MTSHIPIFLLFAFFAILASIPLATVSALPVLDLDLAASPLLHERSSNLHHARRNGGVVKSANKVRVVRKRFELGYMEEARPVAKAQKVVEVNAKAK